MALTFTSDYKVQTDGVGVAITSNAISAAVGDVIVVVGISGDSTQVSNFTASNNNTAISWTSFAIIAAGSECTLVAFRGVVVGTPPTTVTVTASAGTILNGAKGIATLIHSGADTVTPVPAGNIFTASSQSSVTRNITPSRVGSALWLVAGDWGATNSYAAGANNTAQHNVDQAGKFTALVLRPTTQPRTDALLFALAETHTGAQVSYVAFEIQAAPSGGGSWRPPSVFGPGKHPGPRRFQTPPRWAASTSATSAVVGAGVGSSISAAQLTGSGALLAGSIAGTFSAGVLSGAAPLSGASAASAISAAFLLGNLPGNTAAVETSIAAAQATGTGALLAATTSISIASGLAQGAGQLAASAVSMSTSIGLLQNFVSGNIAAAGVGYSIGAAQLSGVGAALGAGVGYSVSAGVLTGAGILTAAAVSQSTSAAQLTAAGILLGASVSGSISAGALTTIPAGTIVAASVSFSASAGLLISLTPAVPELLGGHNLGRRDFFAERERKDRDPDLREFKFFDLQRPETFQPKPEEIPQVFGVSAFPQAQSREYSREREALAILLLMV